MDISGLVAVKAKQKLDCHSLLLMPGTIHAYHFFFEYIVC